MPQTTDTVLMIRPAHFGSNPETAPSNAFQHPDALSDLPERIVHRAALDEFTRVVAALTDAGVRVCVVDDLPEPVRPDAIFPNNWFSTHDDGTVVLYPMHAPSRRAEVRHDVIDELTARFGFRISRVLDLSRHADAGLALEGTGSMVLDRDARIAYACLSARTHRAVLDEFCAELGYEPCVFTAVDPSGVPIYHTNVQMWIGTRVAAVCFDAIPDEEERESLRTRLAASRSVIDLTHDQVAAFAGNALELRSADGGAVVAMSAQALAVLTDAQRRVIEGHARIAATDIATIERCSGGSVRCMLAEIFLPRVASPE